MKAKLCFQGKEGGALELKLADVETGRVREMKRYRWNHGYVRATAALRLWTPLKTEH